MQLFHNTQLVSLLYQFTNKWIKSTETFRFRSLTNSLQCRTLSNALEASRNIMEDRRYLTPVQYA